MDQLFDPPGVDPECFLQRSLERCCLVGVSAESDPMHAGAEIDIYVGRLAVNEEWSGYRKACNRPDPEGVVG